MEWINGTGKKCGGIIGITKTTSALYRWTLSYNLRSDIAHQTHAMYNHCLGNLHLHKITTKSDKDDESALLSTLQGFNVFSNFSHPETRHNLTTKDLATAAIQDSLLLAKELGQEEISDFVRQRLIVPEQHDKPDVSFHDIMHRNNASTFSILYKVVKNPLDSDAQRAYHESLRQNWILSSNDAQRDSGRRLNSVRPWRKT